tara:strand:- start:2782 stop:3327 length:546 start_codon:yes stop_codon:yes gene_type:complete
MRATSAIVLAALFFGVPESVRANVLVEAARAGDLESVQSHLSKGADANGVNAHGESALEWASFNGQTRVVAALLGSGGDANRRDALGNAPVLYAAAKGRVEVLRLLIGHGADCNTRGRNELTPLMTAARAGHVTAVEVLLENGSQPHAERKGTTALSMARRKGHRSIVCILRGGAGSSVRP